MACELRRPDGHLHGDDLDELLDAAEVIGVAGVQRELGSQGCGRDQQIDGPCSPRFARLRCDDSKDAAIGACSVSVEREWVERCFGTLQPILSATALVRVVGGMWPGSQLSQAEGAYGNGDRKPCCVDLVQVDEDRRVEEARSWRGSSRTRHRFLICGGVEIRSEALVVDARRGPEHGHRGVGCHESVATEWGELADRDAVARHDERPALVELSHDLTALVPELSLADLTAHGPS
jgi:hypothetical protein